MLPVEFKERMIALIGVDEARRLFEAIEKSEQIKAFRVNAIKTNVADFEKCEPQIDRKPAPFPSGAYITLEEYPGSLACHHSGAVYMQDISAMSTVTAVKLPEGARVLDSCSAPGGKTTQLSAEVGDRGVVLANEYDAKRSRILQGNVERMGCRNTVVVNLDTRVLAERYPEGFDAVLCDAPCSGEGMFRKNPQAICEWSVDNVIMCAERQREILSNVVRCVAPGGYLIYSTCTFSLEENEMNIAWLLDKYCDFELVDVEEDLRDNTADGIMLEGCSYDMKKCRRIYPHLSCGEGQFIALFKRDGSADSSRGEEKKDGKKGKKLSGGKVNRQETEALAAARRFLDENLVSTPVGELVLLGQRIYLKPDIELPDFGVVSAGVCVGEVIGGRIEPHHQLFSAYGQAFARRLELSSNDPDVKSYLRGEEIAARDVGNGYCAVLVDGCALGGGKISSGRCKNHYPKGLRNKKDY